MARDIKDSILGLLKLKKESALPAGIRVVCVLTGNGLKDTETATKSLPSFLEIDGTWPSIREALS